jgi:hypothetical protein
VSSHRTFDPGGMGFARLRRLRSGAGLGGSLGRRRAASRFTARTTNAERARGGPKPRRCYFGADLIRGAGQSRRIRKRPLDDLLLSHGVGSNQ